jgi:hypothetical protein
MWPLSCAVPLIISQGLFRSCEYQLLDRCEARPMMCEGLWLMHLLDLKIVTRALNKPAVRGAELPSIGVSLLLL